MSTIERLSKARYELLNALDVISAKYELTDAERIFLLAREGANLQSYVVHDEIISRKGSENNEQGI